MCEDNCVLGTLMLMHTRSPEFSMEQEMLLLILFDNDRN